MGIVKFKMRLLEDILKLSLEGLFLYDELCNICFLINYFILIKMGYFIDEMREFL